MILLFLGANYYVFCRIWAMIPNNVVVKTVFIVLATGVLLSFFLSFFLNKILPLTVLSLMYRVGTSWIFIFIYLLMIFLILDLLRITHLAPVGQFMYHSWLGLGILAGIITMIMGGGYINYLHKERVPLEIVVDKQQTSTDNFKIVAISDLHLGYGIGRKEFERWVELINKEEADLLLLAGDIVDNDCRPLYHQQMAEIFHGIQTKYGIYAALGNHEYISNASQSMTFLQDAGIVTLQDSAILVNNQIYILGRDDRSNPNRKSIEELIANLDRNKPIIMLDHQPYHLEEAEINNIDLQISGHTHYGQIWPISWITDLMYEKSHGYLRKGNSHIYVTSGIGIWGGKFRIGTNSEYVVIDFKVK